MNTKRLLKLADYLEKLDKGHPKVHFRMQEWFRKPKNECKTSACALGHACFIPGFRRMGLRLVEDEYGSYEPHVNGSRRGAVYNFFDLSSDEAATLWFSGMRMKASQKAAQIRKMVAKELKQKAA